MGGFAGSVLAVDLARGTIRVKVRKASFPATENWERITLRVTMVDTVFEGAVTPKTRKCSGTIATSSRAS